MDKKNEENRPIAEVYKEDSTEMAVEQTHEGDNGPRRSERLRIQEAKRQASSFDEVYGAFKVKLRSVKAGIQEDLPEMTLCNMQTDIEESFASVERYYEVLKECVPYVVDFKRYQRRIISAAACCKDMVTHLSHRICDIGVKEFDPVEEVENLNKLKKPYAASVYSVVTRNSLPLESQGDQMEATWQAELAAKQARLRALEAQESERARLAELEAEQRSKNLELERAVEKQRRKLELMQARQEVEEADARYRTLSLLSNDGASVRSVESSELKFTLNPSAVSFAPNPAPMHEAGVGSQLIGEASLAKALANAMDRNRLPVPTPIVFNGNPLEFLSFKKGFKTLIEDKGITAEEKIYYLQQYVTGNAKSAIEGCFYGTTEADYERAWKTLESRYGHPFKVQKAFREKLESWPRIGPKDGAALQKYADYLRCCCDAMPHVQGLSVLNDCNENQRLAAKLPDWAITRWSRLVTDLLDNTHEYPTFADFVRFVEREARTACHPVASVTGVKGKETPWNQKQPKEDKRKDVRAFAIDTSRSDSGTPITPMGKESVLNGKLRTEVKCLFCNGGHNLASCRDFGEKELKEKVEFVNAQKLCFGCLKKGHFSRHCRIRHTCMKCKGKHPTTLHDEGKARDPQVKEVKEFIPPIEDKAATALSSNEGHASTTNVVPVWVSSCKNPGVEKLVYALLDTQSDSTFIDERLCEELLTETYPVKLRLTTMAGRDTTLHCRRAEGLKVRGYTSAKYIDLPHTYTQDFIPLDRKHIPTRDTALNWEHLSPIASEMPPLLNCEVGLLVGYNCSSALAPRQVITGEDCQPFAVRTDLGWSIVGSLATTAAEVTGFCHRVSIKEAPPVTPRDLLIALEADFKDTEVEVSMSQDNMLFLKQMQSGIMQNSKGHLEMPLPFKCRPNLLNNKKLAVARLSHLKKLFDRDPSHKLQYCEFMEAMIKNGEAEKVSDNVIPGEVNYIPHHGVRHPKKPEKLRVVFDCAAKFKGTSLNDHLLSGPDLTNNLLGVLCRFRRYPVVVMCDIEKMFHRFYVKPEDRDYLRFLWWEGGETGKSPQEYRMNVHLFGATSSPGCANFGLKHLAKLHKKEYPLASSFILNDFYVDDGVASVPNSEAAIQMIAESRALCSLGRLRLCKFVSNDRTVIENIPESERAAKLREVDLSKDNLPMERTLGLQWNTECDNLTFRLHVKEHPDTRRGILSVIASIYDPLGLVSPFVLLGKIILQSLCKRGMTWDDALPKELQPRWERWKDELMNLASVEIPRCYLPVDFGALTKVELHHFCDASTNGYGACSYLRFIGERKVHCSLVIAKARVSPTKVVTIPRLELTASVVAVKLSMKLRKELQMNIDEEYFWTDSQVVLSYINNDAKKFHMFVANRVQFIKEHTGMEQWRYVPTSLNPADHASRGRSPSELVQSSWYTGPKFLREMELGDSHHISTGLVTGDPEVRANILSTQASSENDMLQRMGKFSDWSLLTRVVARILRLGCKMKGTQPVSVQEINKAGLTVVKLVHSVVFHKELRMIVSGKELPSNNHIYALNPYVQDGVIRVGGRLRKSTLALGIKHPVVLPRRGHITQLIIAHYHNECHHQGRSQTLNTIRNGGYWILGGSKAVAEYISKCVQCRRLRRPAEDQKMADLPEERVESSPPFSFCGMDCFGPFRTKHGRKEYKRYGLLFTCFCSRAIHIEMLDDMTTDAFINALRCFLAIRGTVTQIRADQGSNFIGAKNELAAAMKELDMDRVITYLSKKQCNFEFNAPQSSHCGGVWERQIRSVRSVLNSTIALYPGRLDDSSLRTLFYEAMLIVNSRPLTPVNADPDEQPLTPNHLITMKPSLPLPPPGTFVEEDLYARKRWRRVQYLSEQFWSRWRKEYVINLSRRQKWLRPRRNISVGDVVLLVDEFAPRMEWPLARVVETRLDADGLVRHVKIQKGNSTLDKKGRPEKQPTILERHVQKVVVLLEV